MSSSPLLVAHPHNHTHAQSTQTQCLRNEYSYIPFLIHIIPLFIIMFNYTIEVPNTNIREERTSLDECWDICYDMAQQFGYAEVVFYALNGNRVVQGSYSDQD
tara:strand:- start:168 stop:476 length:309 start_codon:yes stop_codon:yes gene_type:complete